MKKILFAILLALTALSFSGCYTKLMLNHNSSKIFENDDYIVQEDPADYITDIYNDDYPLYYDYDSVWDWGFCFDPFYGYYYWSHPFYSIWYSPFYYSYYPYYYGYGWYYSPFVSISSGIYNSYAKYDHRRSFKRRQPFNTFTLLANTEKLSKSSLERYTKNGTGSLRIRKTYVKRNLFQKISDTYRKISRYSDSSPVSIRQVSRAVSRISSGSGNSSSRSRSSSGSTHRNRK